MEKAFDLNNLKQRLSGKGLDIAEDLLKVVASEVLDWTGESCTIHENQFLKFAAPLPSLIKPLLLGQIDKIDGREG